MRGELTEHIPAPHRTCRFLENWLQVSFLETISWPAPSYVSEISRKFGFSSLLGAPGSAPAVLRSSGAAATIPIGYSCQLTYSRTQRTLSIFFSTTGTSAQLILTGSCISIA